LPHRRYDLVVFDCDGVLIDSEPISNRVHAAALTRLGYPLTEAECVRRFTGMPDQAMYEIIEKERGAKLPDDYDERTKALILDAYRRELRAIPGVAAALAAIRHRVCVASSSRPEKIELGLGLVGLLERFLPHLFSASMVARGKPAPDLVLFAARRMGAAPERCLVIEDSVAGVTAAGAAGMAVLGFTGGGHCRPGHGDRLRAAGARLVFGDMALLPALIADLDAVS
jgi:HAD superfamily hydrolase (TIGR01509 family)